MNNKIEQDISLEISETDTHQRSLFPTIGPDNPLNCCDHPSTEPMQQSFYIGTQAISHKCCCYIPTGKLRKNEPFIDISFIETAEAINSTIESDSQQIDNKSGFKNKNKAIRILSEREQPPSLYESDYEFLESKRALELHFKIAQVNTILESRYEEFTRLYRNSVASLGKLDRVVERIDKKLLSIPSDINKMKVFFRDEDDTLALYLGLGAVLNDLDNETEFLNGKYKKYVTQRSCLYGIIAAIESVEYKGGKLTEKNEIVKMLSNVLGQIIKTYKWELKKIKDAQKRITKNFL